MSPRELDRQATAVERVAFPALLAFVLGLIFGDLEGRAAVRQATMEVAQERVHVAQWRAACEPLLSWPIESTPMLIDADRAAAPARAMAGSKRTGP